MKGSAVVIVYSLSISVHHSDRQRSGQFSFCLIQFTHPIVSVLTSMLF